GGAGGARAPGPWAVQEGKRAVAGGAGEHVALLAAQNRGRGEIFMGARLEADVVRFGVLPRLPQRIVVDAEGRAAIARDETAGVEAGVLVALALHDRQAHERLDARQINSAGAERVFVVEADGREVHGPANP